MKFIINIQKRYIQSPVKHPNQLMLKESGNFEKLLLATFKVLCTNINTMAYGRKTGGRGKPTKFYGFGNIFTHLTPYNY